ncbi:MAG: hypothetical protein J1F32_05960 [Erysipelotrichales bacterium]|nr:hypothetical protein [Erysipelotrichales bacterium]
MKKRSIFLFATLLLTSCFDANGYWTEQETENMSKYAETIFSGIIKIVNDFDGLVISTSYGGSYKFSGMCPDFVHNNVIYCVIQEMEYFIVMDLAPNNQDEIEIHKISFHARSYNYDKKDNCNFNKDDFLVVNNFLDYLDDYVSANTFINLNQIESYMHIAKENYTEDLKGGDYEEKINNKNDMAYYEGWFAYIEDNETLKYYNAFVLDFFKCPKKINSVHENLAKDD